jgi:hypothetical protein
LEPKLARQQAFCFVVSGHDFSRAVKDAKRSGL